MLSLKISIHLDLRIIYTEADAFNRLFSFVKDKLADYSVSID